MKLFMKKMFRSTGSYEPDQLNRDSIDLSNRFRSTGSYEPDHQVAASRNFHCSFDPQALTSLTNAVIACSASSWLFRSTGSYEPDQYVAAGNETHYSFDPQALTSLTRPRAVSGARPARFRSTGSYEPDLQLDQFGTYSSMFRSTGSYEPDHIFTIRMPGRISFDPQALTSLT